MALRGGSSLLRSLARLTNSHVAASSRMSSGNTRQSTDYSFLTHNKSVLLGDIRLFGTSPRVHNVSVELSEALKHEIEAEKELESQAPSASPSMFPGFTVTTKDAEVRLTKKHGNESILVVFNVNHSVEIAEDMDDSNHAPQPVSLPPFSIEITKGEERLCFHLELVEADQPGEYDFQVDEFYIAPAVKGTDEDVPSHIYATSGKYIDSALQDLLYVRYLEERGFDGEFLKNLVSYSSAHEHSLYINLLSKMKAFISK